MTTSGTVDQTQVDVAELLELAFARCGKPASTISGEQLEKARTSLFLLLTNLANRGISLWCLKKSVLMMEARRSVYPIPSGTVDVVNALYRKLWPMNLFSPFLDPAEQGVVLSTPQPVNNVSGRFSATGTAQLVVEASDDGLDWVQLAALSRVTIGVAGSAFCIDLDNTVEAAYWRLRDISGTIIPMTDLQFRCAANEVNMAKLNRDDYQLLPNKSYTGQQATQFWFDKQIDPQLWVWPVPNVNTDQIVVWGHQLIQDVGYLTNELAVPSRWYESITFTLSARVALIIPPRELPAGRLEYLEQKAEAMTLEAEDGESDGSPMRLSPRIGGYTR